MTRSSESSGGVLRLYIPRPDTELHERIWEGSGIVGSLRGDNDRVRIDFEGNADLYPTYRDRVRRAAERHQWTDGERSGYPTRACAYCSKDVLIDVGRYDLLADELRVDDPERLQRWLDDEDAPPVKS